VLYSELCNAFAFVLLKLILSIRWKI
jgi:hypothetical protein